MSRNEQALGPKLQVKVGDQIRYRNGQYGTVLTVNAKTTSQTPATYPIYTQHAETNIVYAHREDGLLGLAGQNPHDIVPETQEIDIYVRLYRGQNGELHSICSPSGWPSAPFPPIGGGKFTVTVAGKA